MVTVPDEIDAAAAILDDVCGELQRSGCRRAAAARHHGRGAGGRHRARPLRHAAFFSIGSNDLTQYVTASSRDIAAVAHLSDPGNPAVLRLIGRVVAAGARMGRNVSLCGDMGGDPAHLPALMRCGLRTVSVAPRLVGRTKLAIAAATAAGP